LGKQSTFGIVFAEVHGAVVAEVHGAVAISGESRRSGTGREQPVARVDTNKSKSERLRRYLLRYGRGLATPP
jgi:hypothetical protein